MIGFGDVVVGHKWVALYVIFQFGGVNISLIYIYWPSLGGCFKLQ